jgi:hypothetical protein
MSRPNTTSNPHPFLGIWRTAVHRLGKFSTAEGDRAKEEFLSKMASSDPPRAEEFGSLLTLLREGAVDIQCLASFTTNGVYYAMVSCARQEIGAVYKPAREETPLSDFPTGTFAFREAAAFLVSEALGWHLVPPTVYRDEAPLGPGALQVYVNKPSDYYLPDFLERDRTALERVALFDLLTNNADRKRAHLLPGNSGRLWSIDHGLCFHQRLLVRTFIEEFDGQPIPEDLLGDVAAFRGWLESDQQMAAALTTLLSAPEMAALRCRADQLLTSKRYAGYPHRLGPAIR